MTGVGNESVTVAGGATTLTVGGTGDTIQLLNGTGNIVVSNAGAAAITVDRGTNRLTIQRRRQHRHPDAGINTVTTSGAYDTIQGGSGTELDLASGSYTNITAGSGTESIIVSGQNDTIDLTAGTDTLTEAAAPTRSCWPAPADCRADQEQLVALNDTLGPAGGDGHHQLGRPNRRPGQLYLGLAETGTTRHSGSTDRRHRAPPHTQSPSSTTHPPT